MTRIKPSLREKGKCEAKEFFSVNCAHGAFGRRNPQAPMFIGCL
jgi:hypothetical protein